MPDCQLKQLVSKLVAFRDAREWKQFHNPKDLAAALAIEAAELQEIFLWKSPVEVAKTREEKPEAIRDEVADIASFLLLLCHELDIDLDEAISAKLEKNAAKYPVHKSKGRHRKYDEL